MPPPDMTTLSKSVPWNSEPVPESTDCCTRWSSGAPSRTPCRGEGAGSFRASGFCASRTRFPVYAMVFFPLSGVALDDCEEPVAGGYTENEADTEEGGGFDVFGHLVTSDRMPWRLRGSHGRVR